MNRIEEIEKLASNNQIEKILEKENWKNFEEIVAEIFSRNDFHIKRNFRFKIKKGYEIDVLAIRGSFAFCVDCKKWSRGRYKKSGLKKAVKSQEKRIEKLKNFLKRNPIEQKILKIEKQNFFSLIVTLREEDIYKESKTFIVPIYKLNSFLIEFERYI